MAIKIFLGLNAFVFIGYGIACLVSPAIVANAAGLQPTTGDGIAEYSIAALQNIRRRFQRTAVLDNPQNIKQFRRSDIGDGTFSEGSENILIKTCDDLFGVLRCPAVLLLFMPFPCNTLKCVFSTDYFTPFCFLLLNPRVFEA